MRKLITLFSTLSLLSSSVSTIVACGTGDGSKIQANFENEPSNKEGDPLVDYVNMILNFYTNHSLHLCN